MSDSESKVINLSEAAKKNDSETKDDPAEENFAEVMRKNQEKKRKLEEERKKSNKSVIRSYRLKH